MSDATNQAGATVPTSAETTTQTVVRITWIGVVVNVLLSALKFTVGVLGRSQAVVADAVHSVSDLSTDVAILFGVRYWSAPADDDHPYGHGRIETIVTALIGVTLATVGIGIGYQALLSLRAGAHPPPRGIAFIGAAVSILSKEILYRWTLVSGKRIKSSAVVANAWHHRSDAMSSIPVAIAVVLSVINPAWSFLDHVGALVVSILIVHAAWRIVKPALSELMDTGVSAVMREHIRVIITATPEVRATHAIRTRRAGPGIYVDVHVLVDGAMSVNRGHEISEIVEQRLLKECPDVADVVVHLEPFKQKPDARRREQSKVV